MLTTQPLDGNKNSFSSTEFSAQVSNFQQLPKGLYLKRAYRENSKCFPFNFILAQTRLWEIKFYADHAWCLEWGRP